MNKLFLLFGFLICTSCTQVVAAYSDNPDTLMKNAEIAANSGRGGTAFKSASKALELCQQKGDKLCEAEVYNTLNIICDNDTVQGGRQCGPVDSLEYLGRAEKIYKELGKDAFLARTYGNIALVTSHLRGFAGQTLEQAKQTGEICGWLQMSEYHYITAKNNSEEDFDKIAELRNNNNSFYGQIKDMGRELDCKLQYVEE